MKLRKLRRVTDSFGQQSRKRFLPMTRIAEVPVASSRVSVPRREAD